jgi:adenine-specific DNA-methyltransferase
MGGNFEPEYADEVFGVENFINLISVRTKSPSGFKTVNLGLFETAEYIFMYGKSKKDFQYNVQYVNSGYDENYTGYISNIDESPENWQVDDIRKIICREEGIDLDTTHQPYSKLKEKIGEGVYFQKLSDLALSNSKSVFRLTAIGDDAGKETLEVKKKSKKASGKVFVVKRDGNDSRYLLDGQEIAFYSKKIKEIDGKEIPTTLLTNIWSDIAYEGIASEGGVRLKKGKKPEYSGPRNPDNSLSYALS